MSPLRIATFNLLHGQPLDEDGSPLPLSEDPAASLAEAVAALDADVLAMQEVDRYQERSGLVDQAAVAAKALGAGDWRFAAALHGRPAPGAGWIHDTASPGRLAYGPEDLDAGADQPSYGTALITRLPVHHWRARRFAPAPFGLPLRVAGRRGLIPVPDEPRAALAAVLEGSHGPFTVVAAHLSFVPGWNMGQLAGIRRWISDLPAPYLLLGDFNLIGPVPRTVLGGAAIVDGLGRERWRRDGTPRREHGREAREARRIQRRLRARRGVHLRPRPAAALPQRALLQGWRDLARTPTYPAHRPSVQFDHVLAVGVPRSSVLGSDTPALGVSDHRPLLVRVDL